MKTYTWPRRREYETVISYKMRLFKKALELKSKASAEAFVDQYIEFLRTLGLSDAIGDDPTMEYGALKKEAIQGFIGYAQMQTKWTLDRINRVVDLYKSLLV